MADFVHTELMECYEDELSPAQKKSYNDKLLAFNENSLQIKRFLTARNATRIGLKKTAQLYKFNGICMTGSNVTNFKVIDFKSLNKLKNDQRMNFIYSKRLASDARENSNKQKSTQKNLLQNFLGNENSGVSCSTVGNIHPETAQKNLDNANFVIWEARKINSPMLNSKSPLRSSTVVERLNKPDSHKQFSPSVNDKTVAQSATEFTNCGKTSSLDLSIPTINKKVDQTQKITNCIDLTMEGDYSSKMEASTTSSPGNNLIGFSAKLSTQRDETREYEPVHTRIRVQERNQLFNQLPAIHQDNRVAICIRANGQEQRRALVMNAKRIPQVSFFSKFYENISHNASVVSIDKTNSNTDRLIMSKSHFQQSTGHSNQADEGTGATYTSNNRENLPGISDTRIGLKNSMPTTNKPEMMVLESEDNDVDYDYDPNKGDADQDELVLDNFKLISQQKINRTFEEISDLDNMDKGISRKQELTTPDKSRKNEDNCGEFIEINTDEEDSSTNLKSSVDDKRNEMVTTNHIDSKKQELNGLNKLKELKSQHENSKNVNSNKNNYEGNRNNTINKSIPNELLKSTSNCKLASSLPEKSTKNDNSTKNTFEDIRDNTVNSFIPKKPQTSTIEVRKNHTDGLPTETSDSSQINFLDYVSCQLESISRQINPTSYDEETMVLWETINKLLSLKGLDFIQKLFHLGLVRTHQICKCSNKTNNRTMALKVQGNHSEKKVSWRCRHCSRSVSVFHGSIFEGAENSPSKVIRLIYYWCILANMKYLLSKKILNYSDVSKYYTRFRAVCTAALYKKIPTKLGGASCHVQVSYTSIDVCGAERFIVIGALQTEKCLMIIKALPYDGHFIQKNKNLFVLEELLNIVHSESMIVTDSEMLLEENSKNYFPSMYKLQEYSIETNPLPITIFLCNKVRRIFKNHCFQPTWEDIQLILNELVWRKNSNFSPIAMFDTFLQDLSLQNVIELNTIDGLDSVEKSSPLSWSFSERQSNRESIDDLQEKINLSMSHELDVETSFLDKVSADDGKGNSKSSNDSLEIEFEDGNKSSESIITSLNEYYYGFSLNKIPLSKTTINITMNCVVCYDVVADNIDLMKHLFHHALSKDASSGLENIRYCRHCLFSCKGNMEDHDANCNAKPKSPTSCLICLASFENVVDLLTHMRKCHVRTEMPYGCKVCGFQISEFRYIIDHFYAVHKGDTCVQCPFCLQVYTVITGAILDGRVCWHFYNHIKNHLVIGVNRYCYKCCLNFITDRLFEAHTLRDHLSRRSTFEKYTALGPKLDDSSANLFLNKHQKKLLEAQSESTEIKCKFFHHRLSNLNHLPALATCVECNGLISTANHFPGRYTCKRCTFSTCCSKAIKNHIVNYHNKKASGVSPVWKDIILREPMMCECGFLSCLGSSLAAHLVSCGKTTLYISKLPTIKKRSGHEIISIDKK